MAKRRKVKKSRAQLLKEKRAYAKKYRNTMGSVGIKRRKTKSGKWVWGTMG